MFFPLPIFQILKKCEMATNYLVINSMCNSSGYIKNQFIIWINPKIFKTEIKKTYHKTSKYHNILPFLTHCSFTQI